MMNRNTILMATGLILICSPGLADDHVSKVREQLEDLIVKGSVSGERGAADNSAVYLSIEADSDSLMNRIAAFPKEDLAVIARLHLCDANQTEKTAKALRHLGGLKKLHIEAPWQDEWFRHVQDLRLESLWIQQLKLGSKSLDLIGKIETLQILVADGNTFKRGSYKPLEKLVKLKFLSLCESQVHDEDLSFLRKLPQLTSLRLDDTDVTDLSIPEIKRCPKLHYINVSGTKITQSGYDSLRKAFPGALIVY